MAIKHRKLFPIYTATNQTVDCSDLCAPSCPYGCYPYPDFYFGQPPPPPPPLPDQSHKSPHVSAFVVIIVSLLASILLLVGYYAIVVKYCSNWNTARNRAPPPQADGPDEEDLLDEPRGPPVDHHIWYIATVGLQQSIINSISVCKYKKGEGLIEGTECSVCLSEFQEDETLRLLPKCSHAFHIPCIDTWLRSHTNCPLCRARIVTDTSPAMASVDRNSIDSGPAEETRMDNPESDGELGDGMVRNSGVWENRAGAEDHGEILESDGVRTSKEGVDSNGDGVIRASGHLENNLEDVEDKIMPVRRSFSGDSSSAATVCPGFTVIRRYEPEGSSGTQSAAEVQKSDIDAVPNSEGGNSSMSKLMDGSSIAQSLHESPDSVKRSLSCGGKFFLSRQGRTQNSILPF